MDETFDIRPAVLTEASVIVTHRRRMFEDMGYTNRARLAEQSAAFAVWLRERLENGRYRGWFAAAPGGAIAAGAGLWLIDWPPGPMGAAPFRGYILNVYTEPAFRRRGLARRLVQTIVEWCYGQGITAISLHASDQGRPVYETLGFEPTNEMRLFIKPDGL
jgi:GNAT superfamily N-acetyltransferase